MQILFVKQRCLKLLLNYRTVCAYLMAITYLCTHYFVTLTKFDTERSEFKYESVQNSILNRLTSAKTITTTTTTHTNLPKNTTTTTRLPPSLHFDGPKLYLNSRMELRHRYNLRNKSLEFYSQIKQDRILVHLLNTSLLNAVNASDNGLFVEAGAYDGETWSNTLYLERFRHWTGLLVEPSVENYRILRAKNRNAFSVNSCLCAGTRPMNSSYIEAGPFGITTNSSNAFSPSFSSSQASSTFGVSPIYSLTCHPLASILDQFFGQFVDLKRKKSRIADENLDSHVNVIDYMSLDIEGSEKQTIATFPFERYQFNLLNIEFNQNKNTYAWIRNYMRQYGYVEVLVDDVWYQDMYLAHESILHKLNRDFSRVSQLFK